LQSHELPHRLLRFQRSLRDVAEQHGVRHRWRPLHGLRHRPSLQPRRVPLRFFVHDGLLHEHR
jgi:hypothetical protein